MPKTWQEIKDTRLSKEKQVEIKSQAKHNAALEWMKRELSRNAQTYDDCGEVNCTRLAENCAQALDLYEDDDSTIPEEVFDQAVNAMETMGMK